VPVRLAVDDGTNNATGTRSVFGVGGNLVFGFIRSSVGLLRPQSRLQKARGPNEYESSCHFSLGVPRARGAARQSQLANPPARALASSLRFRQQWRRILLISRRNLFTSQNLSACARSRISRQRVVFQAPAAQTWRVRLTGMEYLCEQRSQRHTLCFSAPPWEFNTKIEPAPGVRGGLRWLLSSSRFSTQRK